MLVHTGTLTLVGTHLNGILTRPALIFLCSLERGLGGGLKVSQHLTMTKIVFVTFNSSGFTICMERKIWERLQPIKDAGDIIVCRQQALAKDHLVNTLLSLQALPAKLAALLLVIHQKSL